MLCYALLAASRADRPFNLAGIAWEASGLVVLHKPAGWKVDTEGRLHQQLRRASCLTH